MNLDFVVEPGCFSVAGAAATTRFSEGERIMSTSTMAPPKYPEIKTTLPGPKGQEIIAADAQFVTPS